MCKKNRKPDLGKRILIIGCAGSGKTTLSNKLHSILKLPIIHLDQYYWTENWGRTPDNEWLDIVTKLCSQSEWIMDGNYTLTLSLREKHATSIIYLDMPRWKCLLRVFLRRFKFMNNKKRVDIPHDCKERLNYGFFKWIWNYPKRSRSDAIKLVKASQLPIYHFKSNKEVSHFIRLLSE